MNFPFSKFYKSSRRTVIDARRHIVFAVLVFILGVLVGFNFFKGNAGLYNSFTSMAHHIQSDHYLAVASNIFIHNIIICYLSLRLGILLGIVPIFTAFITGLSVGWLFTVIPSALHLRTAVFLIPHGIFELPALFLSSGVGIWRTRLLFVHDYETASKENIKSIHHLFIFVVFPLILAAAFMESVLFFI